MSLSELQDAKEQIRQAIDIVDLVGSYVALRRQGRGYVALCPWHDDSRPSLQVNPERQSFKCWVCDIGGDIFSFLMRTEGIEFREALEMLADRAGITLAPTDRQGGEQSQFDRRNLLRAMAWAEKQYCECLSQAEAAEPARRYLAERGISSESISQFRLGFAPASWDWLLNRAVQAGSSPAVLERVGLVSRRQSGEGYYDRFHGRLMFSIRDVRSRPIAFGGRVLPGVDDSDPDRAEAKYINSPETPLFNKSSQLYALDLARAGIAHEQGIVVMEGYTDVIMAHQHGITNAVAVLGTALGERHVSLVRRFTDSVTLVLDGDEAGQRRTMQILDGLLALFVAQEIDLRILTLPEGADPCDVMATQGSDAFRQLLSTSVDALDHKINAVTNGLASAPGTHRSAQAVEEILSALARALPMHMGASSAGFVREQQVLSRLSREFGVTEDALHTRLTAKRREIASRGRLQRAAKPASDEPRSTQRLTLTAWERELLELLLHQPEVLPRLAEVLTPEEIPTDVCRAFYVQALAAMHAGQIPSFDQLMLATDDPDAKSLLVDCDEHGREKLTSDTDQRVRDLLARIAQEKQTARHQSQLAELKQHRLDPQHEQEVLAELFNDFRRRQTGSAPTDG
ncbi:MAG: DNA primase [Planctomycetes bacterium]|nr:DNA primase [Planctomycetota bacterium]